MKRTRQWRSMVRRRRASNQDLIADTITMFGVVWEWIDGEHVLFPHWRSGEVHVYEPAPGMPDCMVVDASGDALKFLGPFARASAFLAGARFVVPDEQREHTCGQLVLYDTNTGFEDGDACPRCAGRLTLDTTRRCPDA